MKNNRRPSNYLSFFLRQLVQVCAPILSLWERRYLKKYGAQPLKHQPIFIIGAPRTGSTILYQTLTNRFDVLYIDNLVATFFRNIFFGFWLSNKLFKQRAHNCFKSQHGNTSKYGFRAPSECGAFWYRWLPRDRHFIDHDDVTEQMVQEIRKELTAVTNFFDKPVVINNNNIALRIRLIKKAFPEARYIIADRAPFLVAKSLLAGRQKVFGSYKAWWSIMPPNYSELLTKPYLEQVVLQHYYINKQMFADLSKLVSPSHWMVVNYSNFCTDQEVILKQLHALCHKVSLRVSYHQNKLTRSSGSQLERNVEIKLHEIINNLDWHDYSS